MGIKLPYHRFNKSTLSCQRIGCRMRVCLLGLLIIALSGLSYSVGNAAPPAAYQKEHPITIDATALTPPTWWHVPGHTPLIHTLDPDSSDAYRSTERRAVQLKPGTYRFGTFTFDFPFTVTLDGVLEFPTSMDQCIGGRSTQTLTIRCTKPVPYGGQRDY
jgi:hypothetical protein